MIRINTDPENIIKKRIYRILNLRESVQSACYKEKKMAHGLTRINTDSENIKKSK
jgi:hypothetical protein